MSLGGSERKTKGWVGIGNGKVGGSCLKVAASMAPTTEKAKTVVDVDLGNRSYPIYIGSGLLDEPDLLQRCGIYVRQSLLTLICFV